MVVQGEDVEADFEANPDKPKHLILLHEVASKFKDILRLLGGAIGCGLSSWLILPSEII